jgi:thioredoxin-like negative regulator of GroEL
MNIPTTLIRVALCTSAIQLIGQAQPPRPPILDPFQIEAVAQATQTPQAEIESGEITTDRFSPKTEHQMEPIELQTDLEDAKRLALEKSRPIFVIFGASWCSWCKKLEADLDDDSSDPIFAKWIVVSLDADNEPDLATEFQVDSLPSLHLMTSSGDIVASSTGYRSPPELAQWLDDNFELATPKLPEVLTAETAPNEEDVVELIQLLATKSKTIRELTIQRLMEHRPQTIHAISQTFIEGRLAQKLAAWEILRSWQAPIETLDPWSPDSFSAEAIAELQSWSKSEK